MIDENFHKSVKVELLIEKFLAFAESSLWRDSKDESIAYFAVGNIEDWLRKNVRELLD